jgi:hypothetical protein
MQIHRSFVQVEKFCPFMCSLSYLSDGNMQFKDIKKRKLMDHFNFSNETIYDMFQYYVSPVSEAGNKSWGTQCR